MHHNNNEKHCKHCVFLFPFLYLKIGLYKKLCTCPNKLHFCYLVKAKDSSLGHFASDRVMVLREEAWRRHAERKNLSYANSFTRKYSYQGEEIDGAEDLGL